MRRAVHGLLAVAMMAGMSLALAGALAAVMSEMSETASRDARCAVWRADLYRTGDSTAYVSFSVASLGSDGLASASAAFADDEGAEHVLRSAAPPGDSWEARGPLNATVTAGKEYLVRVSVLAPDGSESACSRVGTAG